MWNGTFGGYVYRCNGSVRTACENCCHGKEWTVGEWVGRVLGFGVDGCGYGQGFRIGVDPEPLSGAGGCEQVEILGVKWKP